VPEANIRSVSAGYFATMRLPLKAGRFFSPEDTAATPPVVLVNETLARQAPADGAVGGHFGFEFLAGKRLEIVGVVADENVTGPDAPTTQVVYFPLAGPLRVLRDHREDGNQARIHGWHRSRASLRLRARGRGRSGREPVAPALRLARRPDRGLRRGRLALAAIGVFGVAAREVTRRTREIGIRVALGAAPGDIVGLILVSGSLPMAVSLAAGAAGSLAASRLLSSLLFGISPGNVTTLFAAGAVLAAVAAAASIRHRMRAARASLPGSPKRMTPAAAPGLNYRMESRASCRNENTASGP